MVTVSAVLEQVHLLYQLRTFGREITILIQKQKFIFKTCVLFCKRESKVKSDCFITKKIGW